MHCRVRTPLVLHREFTVSSTPSPSRVLIIGRSAAERSVIAGAFHRIGIDAVEYERGADLTPKSLRSAHMVVALDQHVFVTRTLEEAQNYGASPLFLPVRLTEVDNAQPKESRPAASPDVPPLTQDQRTIIQRAQELAHTPAAAEPDALRQQFDALAAQVRLLDGRPLHSPIFEGDADDPDAEDKNVIAVRDIYEVMPEHDPRNQDPGPLPELETPKSMGWLTFAAAMVVVAASAYLMLAPPTEQELAEERRVQEEAAEQSGLSWAAHLVYQARAVATRSPLEIQTEPVTCRRLLREGRHELAKEVCARAYVSDASTAGALAQVLVHSHAVHEAIELLESRVQERPNDLEAWELLANAARQVGDKPRERKALEQLIQIHENIDPTAPLRDRLDVLQEDGDVP